MRLTQLVEAVSALHHLDRPERYEELGRLVPELRALAGDEAVQEQTRRSLLTRAARALDPTTRVAATPVEGLATVQRLVEAGGQRGRPRIGDPITTRFPLEDQEQIDEIARARGWVRADGKTRRPDVVRLLVAEALAAQWQARGND